MKQTTVKELAFFGRITAGFTHEIKNVLAIIKESSGLMEDLLSLSKDDPFPHWEKLSHRVEVIQKQVRRGVELATRLNRFAHSPDEPVCQIDLNVLADQLVRLSERFARLKEVVLTVSCSDSSIMLTTSPVILQMGAFTLLESCWNQMPAGMEIQLRVESSRENPCMRVRLIGAAEDSTAVRDKIQVSEGFQAAQQLLDELGWSIRADIPDGFSLILIGAKE